MSIRSPLERVGRIHQAAFERAGDSMPADKLHAYQGWLALHPEYVPSFGMRLESAMRWANQHPETFNAMVADFDNALRFLNESTAPVNEDLFPNVVDYRNNRKGPLPLVGEGSQSTPHNALLILEAARDSGNKLRWGETIKPADGDYYSFHTFVASDQGMAAASLTDLYENYTRTLGLYPDESAIDAIVANAITEAVYLTNPEGALFETYKNPSDEWIFGYEGFSPQFQQLVYGDVAQN